MQGTLRVLALLAHRSSKSKVKELGGYGRDVFFIVDACVTAAPNVSVLWEQAVDLLLCSAQTK